jgi:glyoxylase-like metal-dependent hydrolase (beta-lactamase superfamily II)
VIIGDRGAFVVDSCLLPSSASQDIDQIDSGKDEDGRPLDEATIRDLRKSIAGLDPVIAEFKDARQLPPNVSFDNELNIDVGYCEILVRFLGRGNTAGDAVVYLPKEKIVITGDLLDHPVPHFFGGFPVELIHALRALREIDVQTIVPGHGDLLHEKTYIDQAIGLIETVTTEVRREISQGKRLAEVQDSVPKAVGVDELKQQFAGNDQENRDFFDETFAGLVKAAFNEMIMR